MDENDKPDGRTAMERLARELMDKIESSAATSWCRDHGYNVKGTSYTEDKRNARADIERRIAEADLADDKARDSALGDWKAKADAMDETCRVLGVDSYNLVADAARPLVDEHCELKELREAGRIVPEGVSWPRYEDGEPVRIGDEVEIRGEAKRVERVEFSSDRCMVRCAPGFFEQRPHGERFKRPAPKALGGDGVEVKVGDVVWLAPEYRCKAGSTGSSHNLLYVAPSEKMTVSEVRKGGCGEVAWMDGRGRRWCSTSWLTHERPDSWERLREDARKSTYRYWGCTGHLCDECPAELDGAGPDDRYSTEGCDTAMRLDLVARAERLARVVDGGDGDE